MRSPATGRSYSRDVNHGVCARLVRVFSLIYLTAAIAFAGLLWGAGDSWWPATVLLFGPRWPILAPLLVLVPCGLLYYRRVVPWLIASAVVAMGPFMGFALPWQRVTVLSSSSSVPVLRVVTFNCGGAEDREVIELLDVLKPDIVTLNEWHSSRKLPARLTEGRHVARAGGNVVISRFEIGEVERLQSDQLKPWEQRAMKCDLQTPSGPLQVVCLHLETPRHGLTEVRYTRWDGAVEMRRNTERRRFEAELVSRFAAESEGPLIVAGDFNTPVESRIYGRYWYAWQNVFSKAGFGFGYTKWTRYFGARVDHILVSSHWRVHSAWVGPDLEGDHRPIIAEISLRS